MNLIFEKKTELKTLFEFVMSKPHFLFNGDVYDQVDGVSMGSPLGPSNLSMGFHEKECLNYEEGSKIRHYRRYGDDIFCIVDNEQDARRNFLIFLNSQHSSITFTMEKEAHKKLPFLDVEGEIEGDHFVTKVPHKGTYTGILMNLFSFAPSTYKNGLVRTLIDRICQINNT